MNADDFGRFAESLRDYHASQIAAEAERRLQVVGETNYERLFGTPERAVRTIIDGCGMDCIACLLPTDCPCHDSFGADDSDYDALLKWLRGDA